MNKFLFLIVLVVAGCGGGASNDAQHSTDQKKLESDAILKNHQHKESKADFDAIVRQFSSTKTITDEQAESLSKVIVLHISESCQTKIDK